MIIRQNILQEQERPRLHSLRLLVRGFSQYRVRRSSVQCLEQPWLGTLPRHLYHDLREGRRGLAYTHNQSRICGLFGHQIRQATRRLKVSCWTDPRSHLLRLKRLRRDQQHAVMRRAKAMHHVRERVKAANPAIPSHRRKSKIRIPSPRT